MKEGGEASLAASSAVVSFVVLDSSWRHRAVERSRRSVGARSTAATLTLPNADLAHVREPRPVVIPIPNRVELNGSYLAATTARTITLPTIEVTPYYYATLILRVHEATWSGSATPAKFKIEGFASYPSTQDAREFVESSSAVSAPS